jgi:DNA-binding CsgD family transcriptional regulator
VPEAPSNPRGFKPLVEASRTRSYAAAPLVPENVITGFVHADCYFQNRDVDSHDRDVIGAFGEGLGYAIERTTLLRQVQVQRRQIGRLRGVVDEMVEKVSDAVAGLEGEAGDEDRPTAPALTVPGFEITRREAGILQLLESGEGDTEIAVRLAIPKSSVGWHIDRTVAKLGATGRQDAVARYRALASRSPDAAAV